MVDGGADDFGVGGEGEGEGLGEVGEELGCGGADDYVVAQVSGREIESCG